MWKKLATNTGVQLVGRVTTILIGLVTTAWLTRNLGLEGYGRYTLLVALFVLLDNLADFGSKLVGAKEVSKVEGDKRWSKWSELLVWRGVWAAVITVLGVALVMTLTGFEEFRGVAALSMVMVGLTAMAGTLEVGWQVSLKMERKVAVEVLMSALTLVGFYLAGAGAGLGEVIGVLVGARIISLSWGWLKMRGDMRIRPTKIDRKKFWGWLRTFAPMGWYMLIFAGYDRVVDTMMIGHWWGKQEVGWYGLGYKIYANLIMPAYYLVSSALPVWVGNIKGKDWEKKLFGITMAGAVGAAVFCWIGAPLMVQILGGEQFLPTIGVLRWLSLALVAAYHNHYWGFKLLAQNKEKIILQTGLFTLIINITLNLLVIPDYGIMGAAAVTVATEIMSGLILRLKA
jgi:O-antigen/teichoic acid export membrane protein